MAELTGFVYMLLLLTVQPLVAQAQVDEITGVAGGAVLVVFAAPVALGALGFTASDFAEGSMAAKFMSLAKFIPKLSKVSNVVDAPVFARRSIRSRRRPLRRQPLRQKEKKKQSP